MVASGRTSTLRLFLSSDENPALDNFTDFPEKLAYLHDSNIVPSDSNIIEKLPRVCNWSEICKNQLTLKSVEDLALDLNALMSAKLFTPEPLQNQSTNSGSFQWPAILSSYARISKY
jgi:hypothetical protein